MPHELHLAARGASAGSLYTSSACSCCACAFNRSGTYAVFARIPANHPCKHDRCAPHERQTSLPFGGCSSSESSCFVVVVIIVSRRVGVATLAASCVRWCVVSLCASQPPHPQPKNSCRIQQRLCVNWAHHCTMLDAFRRTCALIIASQHRQLNQQQQQQHQAGRARLLSQNRLNGLWSARARQLSDAV